MKSNRTSQNAIRDGLMPVHEVARQWNAMSGQTISRARCWQILTVAEAKIARALKNERPDTAQEKTQ